MFVTLEKLESRTAELGISCRRLDSLDREKGVVPIQGPHFFCIVQFDNKNSD